MAELSTPLADTATLRLSAIAAALADAEHNRASAGVFSSIPSGWRNLASGYQVKTYRDDADTEHRVEYRFTRTGLALPGDPVVQLVSADVDQVVLAQDGVAHGFTVAATAPTSTSTRRADPFTWWHCHASPSRARPSSKARWWPPCPATSSGSAPRLATRSRPVSR